MFILYFNRTKHQDYPANAGVPVLEVMDIDEGITNQERAAAGHRRAKEVNMKHFNNG